MITREQLSNFLFTYGKTCINSYNLDRSMEESSPSVIDNHQCYGTDENRDLNTFNCTTKAQIVDERRICYCAPRGINLLFSKRNFIFFLITSMK